MNATTLAKPGDLTPEATLSIPRLRPLPTFERPCSDFADTDCCWTFPGGAEARCLTRYAVKYFSPADSRRGQGIQWRRFTDREKAEAFAAANRIYSGPCRVEVWP